MLATHVETEDVRFRALVVAVHVADLQSGHL